jgi:hypothetical protein
MAAIAAANNGKLELRATSNHSARSFKVRNFNPAASEP